MALPRRNLRCEPTVPTHSHPAFSRARRTCRALAIGAIVAGRGGQKTDSGADLREPEPEDLDGVELAGRLGGGLGGRRRLEGALVRASTAAAQLVLPAVRPAPHRAVGAGPRVRG